MKEKLGTKTGWHDVNIDATVLADKPQLRDFIDPMCQKLGQALGIGAGRVD